MAQYKNYNPTNIECLPEIPAHWEIQKLKYCTSINDETLPENTDKDFEINYADISSINNGQITNIEVQNFGDAPSRARRKVKNGDIIVSTVRTYLKAISRINNSSPNLIVSTGFAVIRPQKIVSDYLGNLFLSEYLINEIISRSVGVSYPAINSSEIGNIKIPLPSNEEQTAIANYLDEKTQNIDNLISNKQQLIELLKEERTAIINEAVSGKGKNWEMKKLKYLLKSEKGALKPGPFGSDLKNSDVSISGPVKVYTQRNVIDNDFEIGEDFISDEKFTSLSVFETFENDILVTTRGTIGKTAIVSKSAQKGIIHPCLIRLRVNNEKVLNDWLIIYFNESSFFQENVKLNSNSTIIDVIYGYTLSEVIIPTPSIEAQKIILKRIKNETAKIDISILKIEKEIELMQEYKTALISEVVTGKIKIT